MLGVHKKAMERLKKVTKGRLKVFGSVARGDFDEDSDLDVAVFGATDEEKEMLRKEAERIWLETGLVVDLVFVTGKTNPMLLEEIEEVGKMDSKPFFDRAKKALKAAKALLDIGLNEDSISRSYYAMLNAAMGLLVEMGLRPKTHRGVNSLLWQAHRDGKIPKEMAKMFAKALEARNISDYEPYVEMDKEEAKEMLERAEKFVKMAEEMAH